MGTTVLFHLIIGMVTACESVPEAFSKQKKYFPFQMWSKRRYNEIFFMIDTCQAASMYQKLYSPNILAVASSLVGEDSLSHHVDPAIGVYIIDR